MWDTFTLLAIREKIIRRIEGESLDSDYLFNEAIDKRTYNKSDILRSIALFDKIECLDATFDLSNLISEGLIENDNSVIDDFNLLHPNNTIPEDSNQKKILEAINVQTTEILLRSKRQIINHFRNINYIDTSKEYPEENLSFSFDEAIKYYTDFEQFHVDVAEPYFEEDLDWLYRSIFIGLYKSIHEELVYAPSFDLYSSIQLINPNKLIDEIYYTVKTKLTDEVVYLPQPKTLKEAIEVRNKYEIVRFREILGLWVDAIKKGDIQLEEIIRKDIRKANKELGRLKNIKEYTSSPINFWLNSIGGHIPILSNVLTVTNMFAGLYEKFALKKYNWIMLSKK